MPCKHVHIRYNVKMYLAKINCEDVNWTDVPQHGDLWWVWWTFSFYSNRNVGSSENPELHIWW